jgi:hypothetical protein
MKSLNAAIGALAVACAAMVAPVAHAQTLQVLTAGSSAQFGPFAVAAYQLAKSGGATAFHYTVKTSSCTTAGTSAPVAPCYSSLQDAREGTTIPNEPGNLFVVWSSNGIWAYLSIDSSVGVRGFQAYPRATLALTSLSTLPVSTTTNYTYWADGTNDTALTSTVYTAINGAALTAANTDIRPEDALFATDRAITLGYSVTNPIESFFSATTAHPIPFSLSTGVADPLSGQTIPAANAFVTLPIGAAPIVFLANSSLSAATNLRVTEGGTNNAALLFSGQGNCAGNLLDGVASTVALSPILREPLSGTMNTTEFTNFSLTAGGASQETGINTNPAHQTCGSGDRDRAIGTGEEVNAVKETTTPAATNAVGYAFFSYESTGAASTYKYITLDGVDPINSTYSTSGALPTCPVVSGQYTCPIANGASFPNLRSGSYRSWSMYRIVTDASHEANAQKLVTEAQTLVNSNIPDFVPFSPVCKTTTSGTNDPGLDVYRQHFTPAGITLPIPGPNDGPVQASVHCTVGGVTTLAYRTLGGQGSSNTESGGDAGGVIEGPFSANPTPVPGPTGSRQ